MEKAKGGVNGKNKTKEKREKKMKTFTMKRCKLRLAISNSQRCDPTEQTQQPRLLAIAC